MAAKSVPIPNRRQVGQRLRKARKRAGLTQKQVAEALGVTQAPVSKWEKGNPGEGDEPSVGAMASMARLYQVSLDWLIQGREPDDELGDLPVELSSLAEDLRRPLGVTNPAAAAQVRDILRHLRQMLAGRTWGDWVELPLLPMLPLDGQERTLVRKAVAVLRARDGGAGRLAEAARESIEALYRVLTRLGGGEAWDAPHLAEVAQAGPEDQMGRRPRPVREASLESLDLARDLAASLRHLAGHYRLLASELDGDGQGSGGPGGDSPLTIELPPRWQGAAELVAPPPGGGAFVALPLVRPGRAAARPWHLEPGDLEGFALIARHPDWLQNPEHYTCLRLGPRDRSMAPTLGPGSIVAIHHQEIDPRRLQGRMAALRRGSEVLIRRLFWPRPDQVVGRPDNRESSAFLVLNGPEIKESFLGQVAWWWSREE